MSLIAGSGGGGGGANTGTPSEIRLDSSNGHGSTNTAIIKWTTITTNTGSDLTLTQSATLGDSVTVNTAGNYTCYIAKDYNGTGQPFGISVNSSELTTSIRTITLADRVAMQTVSDANYVQAISTTRHFSASDVIRPHDQNGTAGSNNAASTFYVMGPL
jgi:hypothetical protein